MGVKQVPAPQVEAAGWPMTADPAAASRYRDHRARQWRHRAGLARTLVEHPQVNLVLTQASRHEAAIRAAIAAGNDIYSEWPLTTSTSIPPEPPEPAGMPYIIRRVPSPPGARLPLTHRPADAGEVGEPHWARACMSALNRLVRAAWPTSPTQYQRKTSPTFVFRGLRCDMIKPLWWTGDGLYPVTEHHSDRIQDSACLVRPPIS